MQIDNVQRSYGITSVAQMWSLDYSHIVIKSNALRNIRYLFPMAMLDSFTCFFTTRASWDYSAGVTIT